MPPTSIDELITVHLRYGAGAAALRTRALAHIAAKVLYLHNGSAFIPITRITQGVATVVGVRAITRDALSESLDFLKAMGVSERGPQDGWRLTNPGKVQIEADLSHSDDRVRAILANHFPGNIDGALARRWFRLCCASCFARFGNRLVATICRCAPPGPATPGTLEGIVQETARRFGLDAHTRELLAGFREFLTSSDRRDQDQIWSMSQAMFTARLVAAEIGAEPILTRDIRDSLVFLDTNVLLTGALEAHKLAPSFAALSKAFIALSARPVFLHLTKEEYQRTVDYYREITLRAIEHFPDIVVRGASDAFIRTAVGRGCDSRDDFERFFNEIADPIRALGEELPIAELDDIQTDVIAEQGANDRALNREIADIWLAQRHRPKSDRVVAHDAALTAVVESLVRDGRKCWALTLDLTMQELALRRAGRHSVPLWISMDSIIQILAVDSAGPGIQAEDFAPLLASIVEFEVEPMLGAYTVEDLSWLLDIEERSADLEEDKVISIATTIARARVAGKAKTDPELQLEVVRAFQKERLPAARDIAAIRMDVDEFRRAHAEERALRIAAENSYVPLRAHQIRRGALLWFAAAASLHLLAVAAVAVIGFVLTEQYLKLSSMAELTLRGLILLLPGGGAFYRIKDVHWSSYRRRVKESDRIALDELRSKQQATR